MSERCSGDMESFSELAVLAVDEPGGFAASLPFAGSNMSLRA